MAKFCINYTKIDRQREESGTVGPVDKQKLGRPLHLGHDSNFRYSFILQMSLTFHWLLCQTSSEKIDVVNIFRRPEFVEEIVNQAIQVKAGTIWMQEDVVHEKAAEKARRAGIFVVMDRCILKEHRSRFR